MPKKKWSPFLYSSSLGAVWRTGSSFLTVYFHLDCLQTLLWHDCLHVLSIWQGNKISSQNPAEENALLAPLLTSLCAGEDWAGSNAKRKSRRPHGHCRLGSKNWACLAQWLLSLSSEGPALSELKSSAWVWRLHRFKSQILSPDTSPQKPKSA